MKIQRMSKFFLVLTVLCSIWLFLPETVQAANPKEIDLQPNKVYKNYDLTGNGKKDRIKIKTSNGTYSTVTIIINGKKQAVYKNVNDITARLYTLQNGKPFLYLWLVEEDWKGPVCGVFQYKSGKLKQVIDCKNFFGKKQKYGYSVHASELRAEGNDLEIEYWLMSYTMGGMSCRYRFEYKDGSLRRNNSQTSAVKVSSTIMTALKNIKIYASPNRKKALYTLKSGQKIIVTGAYVKSGNFSLKVKNLSTGKSGWLKCLKKFPSAKLFKEVVYTG